MIESYNFGTVVINGKCYTNDVIVFPDRVKDQWWRKEGHKLAFEDLQELMKVKPQIIVIGTGYSGLMKVPIDVKKHLDKRGIQLIIEKTSDAIKTFNKIAQSDKNVVAALHLTC